jgi:multiple sugar transport system ATP-binding protein
VSLGGVEIELPPATPGSQLVLGFRPESLELSSDGVPALVEVVEELGADAYVFCTIELAGEKTKLVARVDARRVPQRGERIAFRPLADEVHVFDAESGERLGR